MPSSIPRRSLLASSTAFLAQPGLRAQAARPNILWILAEDISTNLGCYGEPLVQTPNLDRLAKQGARYTHGFTTAPVCSASRSALATGMYQTTIGAHQHRTYNKQPLPVPVRHMAEHLREAGYFTVLAAPPKGQKGSAGQGNGAWGSGKTDYNFAAPNPFDGNNWAQRPAGKPFFAQLTIQESHKGIGWPLGRKLTPNIDQSKLKLPPYWPDHPVARDEYANYLEAIQLMDRYVGEVLTRLDNEGLADNTLVFFLGDNGACTFRSKQFLYDPGINVPLLVRWPGKVPAGEVRTNFVEGIDITAATLAAAGVPVPSYMQGRDFLAPNATPRPHIFAARDRCDTATERMRCVRDRQFKYIKNYLPAIPYMQRNPYKEKEYPTWNLVKQLHREGKLTPAQALFAAEAKPIEELYDLAADPHEVNNLAELPEHLPRLRAMRKLVDDWVVFTNDQGYRMEDPVPIDQNYGSKRR
ncbi:MAG: sulfatase [Bryobacter sp.]|nr:sulfatase [Bryobacter sp.]